MNIIYNKKIVYNKMIKPNEQIDQQRKQAYFDSYSSCRENVNKYRNCSDPILQQKDNYVSEFVYI